MKFRIVRWFVVATIFALASAQLCNLLGINGSEYMSEPQWAGVDTEQLDASHPLVLLKQDAPSIESPVRFSEFIQATNSHCPIFADKEVLDWAKLFFQKDELINCRAIDRETMAEWLERILRPLGLDFVVYNNHIEIVMNDCEHALMTRFYPFPVVDSDELIQSLDSMIVDNEYKGFDRVSFGILDNSKQSLLVVSTRYSNHMQIEKFMRALYRTTGKGWRMDSPGWTQLNRAIATYLSNSILNRAASPGSPPTTSSSGFCGGPGF